MPGSPRSPLSPPDSLSEALLQLLGPDRVLLDRPGVEEFQDPYGIPGDDSFAASAVVFPVTVAEVQEIVRLASAHGVPVWPHGQGKNLGYGGASPRRRGSIQLSFTRMTAVIDIDEEVGTAIVEPGTTWFDLHAELERRGSRWAVGVPDLGWGSVLGNSLDAGATYMPTGEEYQTICGLDVVLADGSLLRTNHGAVPGSALQHAYRRSLGPALDQFFVQSNLGIVVRAGVWLNLKQEAFAPVVLVIDDDVELELAIDTIRGFRERNLLRGVPSLFPTLRAAVGIVDQQNVAPDRQLSDAEIREIGEHAGVGAWALRAGLWGDRDEVELTAAKIAREWERIPSGRFIDRGVYGPDEYDAVRFSGDRLLAGVPSLTVIENMPSNLGHVGFSPVVLLTGAEVRLLVEEVRARLRAFGRNFTAGLHIIGQRSAILVTSIQYDRTDEGQARACIEFARTLVQDLGAMGYGETRAHLAFMDEAQAQYSFGDHAYRRFIERIKDAVDPLGIIMPGRQGIWGSAYRELDRR